MAQNQGLHCLLIINKYMSMLAINTLFSVKIVIAYSYPSVLTYMLGAIETFILEPKTCVKEPLWCSG